MDLVSESQVKLENEYSVFCAMGSHSSFWEKAVLLLIFPKFHLSILNPPNFLDFEPLSTVVSSSLTVNSKKKETVGSSCRNWGPGKTRTEVKFPKDRRGPRVPLYRGFS